jgi:hypothetical protein
MTSTHSPFRPLLFTLSLAILVLAAAPAWAAPDAAPAAPKLEDLPLKESLSQYGITWTFDKPARVGQFITGDYYVVGEVKIKAIDPAPADGFNGSMLNPKPSEFQGYAKSNGRVNGNEDRTYQAELTAKPPLTMKPGDSLVSTISMDDGKKNRSFQLYKRHRGGGPDSINRAAAVLTCLDAPVPTDTFRPSYCGQQKKRYRFSDLHTEILPSLELTPSAPDIEQFARVFERPWIDHAYSWSSRHVHPIESMPEYGQQVAHAVEDGGLLLLGNAPLEKKRKLLIGYVQNGIDLFGCMERGARGWPGAGGFGNGRKWPILFAGLLFQDKEMQNVKGEFGEDDQTEFGDCWTGANVVFAGQYPVLAKENPKRYADDRGAYEHLPPSKWKSNMGEGYRRCCTSCSWVGQALAARIMHAEKIWNHDAFFAYVDRWMTEDDKAHREEINKYFPDPNLVNPEKTWCHQGYAQDFPKEMWVKYRTNLPPNPDGSKTPAPTETWKKKQ